MKTYSLNPSCCPSLFGYTHESSLHESEQKRKYIREQE